ncbi:unnamed protein product [Rhizoctonia solani]|uniref:Zn(2)-C6 fungal-type domain-containing protein n=1 Tax=Rhizoctonia solani TaxID=456999 RepID=A0A8H3B4P2_9AGAM|nr:unnamed protein product [Rhizoctonia solani]
MKRSRRPGPTGTSCLTCKQRHKKCDQRQPTCERCEAGDFECLGYSHIQDSPPASHVVRSTRRILPKRIESEGSYLHSTSSGFQGSRTLPNNALSQKGRSKVTISPSSCPESSTSSNFNELNKFIVASGASASILQKIIGLYVGLPYSIDNLLNTLDGEWLIDAVVARVEKHMSHWYFKPTNYQERFRQGATRRLRDSKFTRWISLVGVSVTESFLEGDMSQGQLHNTWIEYIEGSIKHELALDLAPREIRDRRSAWVHVSLMRTRLTSSSDTYKLLQRTTPAFLQVVYSNPTLWPSGCDLTRIPLLNIMASESHELAIFTIIDNTYSLASGLPQQVEYDTTIYPRPGGPASHQWVHSSPIEFQLVLADINACRDKSSAARDWRDIERRLLTWGPRSGEHVFVESWMTIAWYAVQETWRLSLLVYLYLAVCDAPSDDPRIQSYVKQILQVIGTVKQRGSPDANVWFFTQYLMVGICARSEAHRRLARNRLASENETKFWLMRASDFALVLDHLWHGAAADGYPVKWSDYIHSREAVLPIVL